MTRLNENNFTLKAKIIFENLLSTREHSDVTLVCEEGEPIKAHKFILGASSPFFKRIFVADLEQNSFIFLHGVGFTELQMVIDYVYTGETEVGEDMMDRFLDTAQYLEIKGLLTEVLTSQAGHVSQSVLPPTVEEPTPKTDVLYEENETFLDNDIETETKETTNEEEIIQKLSDKVRNFPCVKCSYRGTTKKVLKDHIRTKHEGVKFPCGECPYVSATTKTRYMHTLTKHKGLKFECAPCFKEFADPGSLRKHKQYKHEGIRYNCNNCEYTGSTLQQLKFHGNKAHKN